MTDPLPKRTDGWSKSASSRSLSQRLASLAVTSRERNPQTQRTNTSQSQTVASLRNQPIKSATLHRFHRPLRSNITKTPFSNQVASPAPSQLRRNVSAASSSAKGPELDWLPSTNSGNSEVSVRIASELLIAPNSSFKPNTQNFVRDIATKHNSEVPSRHPRMRSRELDDGEFPLYWEIIPLEKGAGQLKLGSSCTYRLKTPSFTLLEHWQDYFQPTWGYLRKYYTIQGINGHFPAVVTQVSTFERALDFKRIVQALIHFNELWPTVFGHDDKDPNKAEPRITVGQSYLSYHPDYWSAIPATGVIHFHIGKKSEVGERSIHWTEFVTRLVMAAINSPSLADIQRHPVSYVGLRAFLLGDSLNIL